MLGQNLDSVGLDFCPKAIWKSFVFTINTYHQYSSLRGSQNSAVDCGIINSGVGRDFMLCGTARV